MFKKKYILILLIAGICMMSAVSAADDASDTLAVDDTDDLSTGFEDDLQD